LLIRPGVGDAELRLGDLDPGAITGNSEPMLLEITAG
jgi:hypothetical protein